MPIDGISPRLPEIGRIRIGVYDEGKGHPEKLETFRLTSSHMDALQAAAKLYGGMVGESKVGYDLVTETDTLMVMLPPQGAFSQYMEQWSAAGVARRCDGITELIGDGPCLCEAEANRVCEPRSNLRVVMPQVPGIGVWRLATQGWTAAAELKGSVALIEEVAHRGQSPTVELVLEQRERKIPGEALRRFAVPVLRLPYTLAELGASETRSIGGAIARVDTTTGEINPVSSPEAPSSAPGETPASAAPQSAQAGEQSAPSRGRRSADAGGRVDTTSSTSRASSPVGEQSGDRSAVRTGPEAPAGDSSLEVEPYPVCNCGHAYDSHRHHGRLGCYLCKQCKGYHFTPSEGTTAARTATGTRGTTADPSDSSGAEPREPAADSVGRTAPGSSPAAVPPKRSRKAGAGVATKGEGMVPEETSGRASRRHETPSPAGARTYPLDPKLCQHTVGIDLDNRCVDCGTKMAEVPS